MALEQHVNDGIKAAMKAKDEAGLRGLRAIKSALLLAKTATGAKATLSEEEETKLLQKLVKQRRDSLEIYQQQNRPDLAKKEVEEIEVIEKFLPEQMDEAAVTEKIREIIAQTGAQSPADMGKVMGLATKTLAGQADGKLIAAVAKKLLAT